MFAIVFDDEAALVALGDKAQAAGGGAGVTNDVGDRFAQSKREGNLFRDGEIGGGGGCGVEHEDNACGVECQARCFDLGSKATGAVATNRLADLGEGGARDAFDVGNLGSGARMIGGILAMDESACKLSFEHNDRERVTENVM